MRTYHIMHLSGHDTEFFPIITFHNDQHVFVYTECNHKFLKFIIRDMLFPTKLTSLINTRGLIDSASLENHHNNGRDSGSHQWPKTFLGRCM